MVWDKSVRFDDNNEDAQTKDIEYFTKLDDKKQKNIIDELKMVNEQKNVPLLYKVFESSIGNNNKKEICR